MGNTNNPQDGHVDDLDVFLESKRLSLEASHKITLLMDRMGLSRADLARKLNIPASRVTKVLDGEANITLRTLAQFGLACDTRWTFEPIGFPALEGQMPFGLDLGAWTIQSYDAKLFGSLVTNYMQPVGIGGEVCSELSSRASPTAQAASATGQGTHPDECLMHLIGSNPNRASRLSASRY